MDLKVHDVGHGQCISLRHENDNTMVWDCGQRDGHRPSEFLPQLGLQRIDRFFVTNYDEDHISDLPALRQRVRVPTLHRNPSISAEQLRALKRQSGPISQAMDSMLNMIETYTYGPPNPPPEFPGVTFTQYWNRFGAEFADTNNISLVTFLTCRGIKFLIPGDVQKEGWNGLLKQEGFAAELPGVNVMIASHHGREDGYSEDVMKAARPNVVVFSDSEIEYATQEMAGIYGQYCSGVAFNGAQRKVLSTRSDGTISWSF